MNSLQDIHFKLYPSPGPIVLYLRAPEADAVRHTADCQNSVSEKCSLMPCYSFADLASLLTPYTEFIAIHIDFIEQSGVGIAEWSQMFSTITHLIKSKVPLVKRIIIRKNTSYEIVKHMKKSMVSGILLDIEEYDNDAVMYSLDQMLSKQPHWPKHVLDVLPNNTKKKINKHVILTERQQQVLQLVCQRGASNKAIAKTLGISESTVKGHMSSIMNTYGVRSRTQLAIFTKSCSGDVCTTCTKK